MLISSLWFQPAKARKKRRSKDKSVRLQSKLTSLCMYICLLHLNNHVLYILIYVVRLRAHWIIVLSTIKSASCSHVTSVAPTSGAWRRPTCAPVSEDGTFFNLSIMGAIKLNIVLTSCILIIFQIVKWCVTRSVSAK